MYGDSDTNMGIPILVIQHLYIEAGSRWHHNIYPCDIDILTPALVMTL